MQRMMNGLNRMNLFDVELYKTDIKKALMKYDFSLLNKKTILITGATGLICSAIIDLLLVLKLHGLKLKIIGAGRNTLNIKERFNNMVESLQYDSIAPPDLPDNINYIIHGASIANPKLYTYNPVETMLSNINGISSLLQYCVGKETRMVYISSSEVYGEKNKVTLLTETDYGYIDLDNIRNSYSESKRASEMLCKAFAVEYGVNISMIRPGHVYGPTANAEDKRISSEFAFKAARGENLEMLSSGLQKRSYCYCIDAACAILLCLLNGISGEAYNIGTKEVLSIRKMAMILADAGRVELKAKEPNVEEMKNFNPMNNSALSGKKIEQLGYKECFSPEEGLTHTVNILKEAIPKRAL